MRVLREAAKLVGVGEGAALAQNPLHAVTDGLHDPDRDESIPLPELLATLWRECKAALLLLVAIFAVFIWQLTQPLETELVGALSWQAIAEGRWWTLFSAMFLHGGLWHLLMNTGGMAGLSLGVGKYLGRDSAAFWRFMGLYFGAGLAGGLIYVALHWGSDLPAVGASGALCGLWGAIARMKPDETDLAPIWSRHVWSETKAFVVANLFVIVPFLLLKLMIGGGPFIAWEAHLGGYLFGLLLIDRLPRAAVAETA